MVLRIAGLVVLGSWWVGCAESPALVGPPLLEIDRPLADFGDAALGTVSPKSLFVITNRGGSTASLRSEVTDDRSMFPVTSDSCDHAELAPGATCAIAFTFAPTRTGLAHANVTVSATGTSVGAELVGNALAEAMLELAPASQDLGQIVLGRASTPFAFVVTNKGGRASGELELHLTGNSDFVVVSDSCSHASVAPNSTCTLWVTFQAAAAGSRAAILSILGTPGGAAKATLGGHGLVPSTLAITPASHDFLIAEVGGAPLSSSLVVTNTGDEASGMLATSYTGPADLGLVNDGCSTHVLDAGASCTIATRFSPLSWGAKHATVTITPAIGAPVTASLAGTGRDSVPLAVAVDGAGGVTASGAPTSSGRALDCPHGSCSESYLRTLASPIITLVAHPDAGYHFVHWTGDACAFQDASCALTLASATAVTATFAINSVPLAITVAGSGSVTSSISAVPTCASTCTTAVPIGTQITLTAHPSGSATIARWTGACSGHGPTCTLTVFDATTVGLAFSDCSGELHTDENTLALWHLNDGSGQVVHDAAGHYDGTLGKDDKIADDDPQWSTGRFGGGLYFDASNCPSTPDEHCEWMHVLTDPLALASGFSLELWIEPTGKLGSTTIDFDDGLGPRFADVVSTESDSTWLSMTNGTQLSWQVEAADGHGPEALAQNLDLANAWHALALTYDGLVARMYVDGVLVGQQAGAIVQAPAVNLQIGGVPLVAFLNGYLDEIRISTVARTPAEISAAYAIANVCP